MARFRRSPIKDHNYGGGGVWTWPSRRFRALRRHWNLDASLPRVLEGLSSLNKRIVRFDGRQHAIRDSNGEVYLQTWPSPATLVNPLWWIAWIAGFAWRWVLTRPYLPMLLALPAAALMLAFILGISAGAPVSGGAESLQYKAMRAAAVHRDDYETAMLCNSVLLKINPDATEHRLAQAVILNEQSEQEAATEIMRDLASEEGSTEAALWLANRVGDFDKYGSWSEDQKREYLHWLSVAQECDAAALSPRVMMCDLFRAEGDVRRAYLCLLPVIDQDIDAAYVAVMLARELGRPDEMKIQLDKLTRLYRDRIEQDARDLRSRLRYASLLIVADQPQAAIKSLARGRLLTDNETEDRRLRKALVDSMVVLSAKIQREDSSPKGVLNSLHLLKDATQIDPSNSNLLEAIANTCIRTAESKNQELNILRESLVQGIDPETSHFILGTVALNQGDLETAMQHLEITLKTNPNLPGLLNNLACAILKQDDADLERALRLSEAAVRVMPKHTYLRETRGQILFRLGRYTEAIPDLEYALASKELRPKIRKSLATAYEALGQEKIAARQRELMTQGR